VPARVGSDVSASASKLRTRSYRWQPRDVQPRHPSNRGHLPFGRSFLAAKTAFLGHWQPENASVAAPALVRHIVTSCSPPFTRSLHLQHVVGVISPYRSLTVSIRLRVQRLAPADVSRGSAPRSILICRRYPFI